MEKRNIRSTSFILTTEVDKDKNTIATTLSHRSQDKASIRYEAPINKDNVDLFIHNLQEVLENYLRVQLNK